MSAMPNQAPVAPPGETPGADVIPFSPLRTEEGFSLQDLPMESFSDPMPFKPEKGVGKIARAYVEWTLRVPEEVKRQSPVVIAHGYFAKEAVYDGVADALAGQGIAVATYKAVRKQGMGAGWHPRHLFNPARLVNQAPWGAIRNIRQREDIDLDTSRFTFVGHSMGGRTSVTNALEHSDSVDGVIMVDPAGLEDHDTFKMIGRLPEFGRKEVAPALASKEVGEAAKLTLNSMQYIIDNPLRTLAEGVSIGNADIKPAVGVLHDEGTPVAVLLSASDTLVHTEGVLEDTAEIADSFVVREVLPNRNLGHLGPLREPGQYGAAVLQVLNHFDSLQTQAGRPAIELTAA